MADLIKAEAQLMISDRDTYIFEGVDMAEYQLLEVAIDRFDPATLVSANAVIAIEQIKQQGRQPVYWVNVLREDRLMVQDHGDILAGLQAWSARADQAATILEQIAADRS